MTKKSWTQYTYNKGVKIKQVYSNGKLVSSTPVGTYSGEAKIGNLSKLKITPINSSSSSNNTKNTNISSKIFVNDQNVINNKLTSSNNVNNNPFNTSILSGIIANNQNVINNNKLTSSNNTKSSSSSSNNTKNTNTTNTNNATNNINNNKLNSSNNINNSPVGLQAIKDLNSGKAKALTEQQLTQHIDDQIKKTELQNFWTNLPINKIKDDIKIQDIQENIINTEKNLINYNKEKEKQAQELLNKIKEQEKIVRDERSWHRNNIKNTEKIYEDYTKNVQEYNNFNTNLTNYNKEKEKQAQELLNKIQEQEKIVTNEKSWHRNNIKNTEKIYEDYTKNVQEYNNFNANLTNYNKEKEKQAQELLNKIKEQEKIIRDEKSWHRNNIKNTEKIYEDYTKNVQEYNNFNTNQDTEKKYIEQITQLTNQLNNTTKNNTQKYNDIVNKLNNLYQQKAIKDFNSLPAIIKKDVNKQFQDKPNTTYQEKFDYINQNISPLGLYVPKNVDLKDIIKNFGTTPTTPTSKPVLNPITGEYIDEKGLGYSIPDSKNIIDLYTNNRLRDFEIDKKDMNLYGKLKWSKAGLLKNQLKLGVKDYANSLAIGGLKSAQKLPLHTSQISDPKFINQWYDKRNKYIEDLKNKPKNHTTDVYLGNIKTPIKVNSNNFANTLKKITPTQNEAIYKDRDINRFLITAGLAAGGATAIAKGIAYIPKGLQIAAGAGMAGLTINTLVQAKNPRQFAEESADIITPVNLYASGAKKAVNALTTTTARTNILKNLKHINPDTNPSFWKKLKYKITSESIPNAEMQTIMNPKEFAHFQNKVKGILELSKIGKKTPEFKVRWNRLIKEYPPEVINLFKKDMDNIFKQNVLGGSASLNRNWDKYVENLYKNNKITNVERYELLKIKDLDLIDYKPSEKTIKSKKLNTQDFFDPETNKFDDAKFLANVNLIESNNPKRLFDLNKARKIQKMFKEEGIQLRLKELHDLQRIGYQALSENNANFDKTIIAGSIADRAWIKGLENKGLISKGAYDKIIKSKPFFEYNQKGELTKLGDLDFKLILRNENKQKELIEILYKAWNKKHAGKFEKKDFIIKTKKDLLIITNKDINTGKIIHWKIPYLVPDTMVARILKTGKKKFDLGRIKSKITVEEIDPRTGKIKNEYLGDVSMPLKKDILNPKKTFNIIKDNISYKTRGITGKFDDKPVGKMAHLDSRIKDFYDMSKQVGSAKQGKSLYWAYEMLESGLLKPKFKTDKIKIDNFLNKVKEYNYNLNEKGIKTKLETKSGELFNITVKDAKGDSFKLADLLNKDHAGVFRFLKTNKKYMKNELDKETMNNILRAFQSKDPVHSTRTSAMTSHLFNTKYYKKLNNKDIARLNKAREYLLRTEAKPKPAFFRWVERNLPINQDQTEMWYKHLFDKKRQGRLTFEELQTVNNKIMQDLDRTYKLNMLQNQAKGKYMKDVTFNNQIKTKKQMQDALNLPMINKNKPDYLNIKDNQININEFNKTIKQVKNNATDLEKIKINRILKNKELSLNNKIEKIKKILNYKMNKSERQIAFNRTLEYIKKQDNIDDYKKGIKYSTIRPDKNYKYNKKKTDYNYINNNYNKLNNYPTYNTNPKYNTYPTYPIYNTYPTYNTNPKYNTYPTYDPKYNTYPTYNNNLTYPNITPINIVPPIEPIKTIKPIKTNRYLPIPIKLNMSDNKKQEAYNIKIAYPTIKKNGQKYIEYKTINKPMKNSEEANKLAMQIVDKTPAIKYQVNKIKHKGKVYSANLQDDIIENKLYKFNQPNKQGFITEKRNYQFDKPLERKFLKYKKSSNMMNMMLKQL